MLRLFQAFYWWVVRKLAWLRYRVEVIGLEKLRDLHGPTLVMPNHPAYIDPPLLLSHIRLHEPIRPIVSWKMYRRAILYPMMRLVEALEIPDLGAQSRNAREQTLAMIDAVVAGLEQGGNFLIYPAGHIQERGIEEIGPARSVAEILERSPQANLVLIRTRGLWGSSFSVAPLGKRPDVGPTGLRGVLWTLANLIFFAPRRKVTMTVEVVRRSDLPDLSRETLNPYLEAWYNRDGPETPTFIPYHFLFGRRSSQFREFHGNGPLEFEKIKQATIQQINEIVEEHLGRPLEEDEKRPETTLNAIGLDSLDRMDTALRIEDRFGFRSDRVAETLGELWALAEGLLPASSGTPAPVPEAWNRPPSDFQPAKILAETVAEAFVRRALMHPGDVVVADRLSGVQTYRKLLVGTRLLSKRIREIPGDAIGVMLPASVAVDIVFLSLHMAGKLPVMLNWTTGPATLAHAVGKLRVTHVITSQKLIDRLGIEVPGAKYVFLEDLRGGVGKAEALATLLATYVAPHHFLRAAPRVDADDPAVILFTSGSESTPKAVPLSHRNLVTNARDGLLALAATRGDAMLACLPPFHSFGLTGNIIAPLLGGIRLVCHPDPTDAPGLVRAIAGYRPTLLLTTPTFLGYIFSAATPDDLRSLRIIVTGAEKSPEAIFARGAELAPGATILEAYGITECSPMVAANRIGRIKAGTVGLPVGGVEVCVVDPESKHPLPAGSTGILLVRGLSVFRGYLEYDGPDPFVAVNGHRWYYTGDLVQFDDEGFIHFRGRLKRFLKAGGEMISLLALEEPLARIHPPTENGPQVAVEGIETPEGRWIVLFTTQDIALREANAVLSEAGFRGVMRLNDVVRLDAIPVLGTGKIDYKVLRTRVVERAQAAARNS